MKILLDARFYGLEHAGLGRYTMNLVHELAKIKSKDEYVILLRKKHLNIELPDNFKKVKAEAKHYWFKEQALLPLIIRKHKPDVVHFLHSNVPVFFTGKFIVTIHDLTMYRQGSDATTLPTPLYYAKRIPFKMVFRKAVYDSSKIITPSQSVKDELVEYFKIPEEKIVVTYEGTVDSSKLKVKSSKLLEKYKLENQKYFLYVGNAYPHKNLKTAIEAIVSFNEEQKTKNEKPIYLVVVSGRGVFRYRLEKEVRKLKAEELVKVLNFVPDEELQILYKNSLAFLFPSLSEGFGLPGLEAMQAGTIVLSSNIPIFKEIYKDASMYFEPKDVDSMTKMMKKVIQMKKEERLKKIKKSQKLLKQYSWENMARETANLYNSN